MKYIGEVKYILNETQLLISSNENLKVGDILLVYSEVSNEKIKENEKIESIKIPKGEIKIVLFQEKDIYLAEIFREIRKEKKTVVKTPPLYFSQLMRWSAALTGETEEVISEIPGKWSGVINNDQSEKIPFNKQISIGDKIGTE